MREAAANLEFETAARLRDEIKRLQATELAIADDPLSRQQDVEDRAGAYQGERKYGRAANLPKASPKVRKPTDDDMGPHNWGGGEATPLRAKKPGLDDMGPGTDRAVPLGAEGPQRKDRPDPGTRNWRKGGRRGK